MPALQSMLSEVNRAFAAGEINKLAKMRAKFATGKKFPTTVFIKEDHPLKAPWDDYLKQMPASFQETVRGIIHHALSTEPPTPVTFAWAPGYDFELTLWHAPDTPRTRGGITVLVKSRYPADAHPLAAGRKRRA